MNEPYFSGEATPELARLPVHIVLDNVRSAFNVGSIFRTADAAGIGCLHLCGITCWPPHPKLEKTSLGGHQYVPWMRHETTEQALDWLSARGVPLVALETAPEALDLRSFQWPQPVAVVLGHEVLGVDQSILRRADFQLCIPMFGVKNSLNVASAFAVVAYDLVAKLKPLESCQAALLAKKILTGRADQLPGAGLS